MTLRRAMAKSLNVATIKVAEMVGYQTVVNLAHRAGISADVKATPAMAIGSYVATPLEMAGAYTVFANKGVRVQPTLLSLVKEPNGKVLLDQKPETKPVLDPRVTYLMVSMLEEVMRTGTGAGVRSRGFVVPAAGKTGTSHDGWFAGFTSDLLCIVWVGYDDYSELNIEGAKSALPVWTEFMKRAIQMRAYSNAKEFPAPDGVVTVNIDPASGMPATAQLPGAEARGLHRRNRTGGRLPAAWRPWRSDRGLGLGHASRSIGGPRRQRCAAPLPYQASRRTGRAKEGRAEEKGLLRQAKDAVKNVVK